MKKMEISINTLHYCIYKTHYKLHLLANKVNPFWLLAELPFFKKRYKKLGVDIHTEVNKAFSDKNNGLSIMVAGGMLFGVFFFFLFAVTKIAMSVIDNNTILSAGYSITFGLLSLFLCYLFVFRRDKYLAYFKDFESWTKKESQKYGWMSFAFIVTIVLLFFASLILRRPVEIIIPTLV